MHHPAVVADRLLVLPTGSVLTTTGRGPRRADHDGNWSRQPPVERLADHRPLRQHRHRRRRRCGGEDEHGIWISGAVRASATPSRSRPCAARHCRAIGAPFAVTLVGRGACRQRPRLPHPSDRPCRLRRKQSALVAAGIAIPGLSETPIDPNTIVGGVLSAIGRREQMAAMMRESGRDPKSKMAALPPRGRTDICPQLRQEGHPVPLHLHRPERAAVHPQHRDRGAGCAGPQRRQRLHPVRGR